MSTSTNSVGARIPEREVLAPFFSSCFCLVHFLHQHTWDSLRKGTLRIKGCVNRVQAANKKRRPVRTLARAAVYFVGGKFRDTWVNYENNEN